MSCQDCFQTQAELQQQFAIVNQAAKVFAVQNNTNVFIFQTPEGWQYMAEQPAREAGIQPNGGIVSGLIPTT